MSGEPHSHGIHHVAAAIPDESGLVAGAAAGHHADAALLAGPVALEHAGVVGGPHEIGMGLHEALEHILDDHIGDVDDSLHNDLLEQGASVEFPAARAGNAPIGVGYV